MLTGHRLWTIAVVLALCTIVTAGCRRKSSKGNTTINNGSDIFTTDSFPGDSVQSGNVSDDKRAFSNADSDFNWNLRVTTNGDRGTAMCTYEIDEGGVQNQIFAHYYNGSTWTPPVELSAFDVDINSENGTDIGAIVHAFINTQDHDSDFARQRDGDCLIFWQRDDVDTGVAFDEENQCLFVTYFDVSESGRPSARYGFQQFAARINSQDEGGEDVTDFGVVTDGLCGQARFGDGDPEYSYGDQTTSIEVFWRQLESNDVVDTQVIQDASPYTARFDLTTSIGQEFPIPPSLETRLSVATFGVSDSGLTSGQSGVDDKFLVYNGNLFWRGSADVAGGTGTGSGFDDFDSESITPDRDVTLQFVQFDLATAAITATAHLQLVTPVASPADGDENNAEFLRDGFTQSIYGADEGLTNTVIFSVQLTESLTGFGVLTNSSHLNITTISDSTGAIIENAGFGVDTATDTDNVTESAVATRISRNGDYIWVVWNQDFDLTAGNDSIQCLRATEYQTTRLPSDGVLIAPNAFATSLSSVFTIATPSGATGDVDLWGFQSDLGYICGAQSNPDIMSVYFSFMADAGSDTIYQAELESSVILGAPTAFVSAFESFEDGQHTFGATFEVSDGDFGFNMTDSGEDGYLFAAYQDDVDGTGIYDGRVFAERTGIDNPAGTSEIDSGVNFRIFGTFNSISFISTPRGNEIGEYDPIDAEDDDQRWHGNQNVHVWFYEPEGTEDDGMGDAIRTRVYQVGADNPTFGEDFVPSAGAGALYEFMFDLDLPFINPNNGASDIDYAVAGNTVGFWFEELGHIYYQEYNDNSQNDLGWRNIDGESDPALVDDDTTIEVDSVQRFFTSSCVCDDLDGAMIFWVKQLDDNSNSERLQVRIRNGGNN